MKKLVKNTNVYFENITHTYWNSVGKELKGVTTLMREQGLAPDYSGISQAVLTKAASRGSAVHESIDNYCKGQPYKPCKELGLFISQAYNVLTTEYLVSNNTSVASSIDVVLHDYSLCDIKTTSVLHTDALRWQLSIYAYLFELQNPSLKVPNLYAIHITKGNIKTVQIERIESRVIEELLKADAKGEIYCYDNLPVAQEKSKAMADFSKAYELMKYVDDLKQQIKEYEGQIDIIKVAILNAMTERNIDSLENEYFKITRTKESKRATVDSGKLKGLYPNVYNECVKESIIAPSVRLTMRK